MAKKKTWTEKLHDNTKGLPKVGKNTGKMFGKWGAGTHVVPAPIEVDELMRKVRKGKLVTIDQLCRKLAEKHRVDRGCPLTTGIFAWVAAHAADEAETAGKQRITPYWRTIKTDGQLNPKYPGGVRNLKTRLEAEGHKVEQKGKRFLVVEFEKRLTKL